MCIVKGLIVLSLIVLCSSDIPCNKVKKKYGYVCVCNATYCDNISSPKKLLPGEFHFYSTSNKNPGFNHVTGSFKMQAFSPYGEKYFVNITKKYQTIRGFGATFTDSFGVTYNKLSYEAQENLMKSFFSEDGIEYTVCRVVFAASDFALRVYTYTPNYDPTLKSFNLTEDDYLYKIPQIRKALNITKRHINLLGSTWTSPEWMKVNNKTTSEYLKKQFQQVWADYHIKALGAFKNEGIEFWGITTGNEPITLYQIHAFIPNLVMFPEEQREWIINNLGPQLKEHNYTTKIIIMDDERIYALWWMERVMRDPLAKQYVQGIGIHWYFDSMCSPTIMDELNKKFPDKEILYTESSINPAVKSKLKLTNDLLGISQTKGEQVGFDPSPPQLGSWHRATLYLANIIENFNHWVTTYIDWNLALNLNGGPNAWNFSCDASVIINETANEFYKQPLFYAMGHFSKFMPPGSVVIDVHKVNEFLHDHGQSLPQIPSGSASSEFSSPYPPFTGSTGGWPLPTAAPDNSIQKLGVLNQDGSRTIIYFNPNSSPVEIVTHDPDRGYAFFVLEPQSVSTLIYW